MRLFLIMIGLCVPPIVVAQDLTSLLSAEFAQSRGDNQTALSVYKDIHAPVAVFERGLQLSLAHESTQDSLEYAYAWHIEHPDYAPAWFYVAHLALKAHDGKRALQMLEHILAQNPYADLGQIIQDISPDIDEARQILQATKHIGVHNPSMHAIKALLYLEIDEPENALTAIDRAINLQPNNTQYYLQKADILKKLGRSDDLALLFSKARARLGFEPKLALYEVRELLDDGDVERAFSRLVLLSDASGDADSLFLLALVGLDLGRFGVADAALNKLISKDADRAHYYLGISQKRQGNILLARQHFVQAQGEFLLKAQDEAQAIDIALKHPDAAMARINTLRQTYPEYALEADLMAINVWINLGKNDNALKSAIEALTRHPNDELLLIASVDLLPNDDSQKVVKARALLHKDPHNPAYQLLLAKILLSIDIDDGEGLALASSVAMLDSNNWRYDPARQLQALTMLAGHDISHGRYAKAIESLAPLHDFSPSKASALALMRAYEGMQDSINAEQMRQFLQSQGHSCTNLSCF